MPAEAMILTGEQTGPACFLDLQSLCGGFRGN